VESEIKYREAVRDILCLLVDRAAEMQGATALFDQGVHMGYFEAVSAIFNELETFGIDAAEVGMAGFNPLSMLEREKNDRTIQFTRTLP